MQSDLKMNIRKCAHIGSSDREPREGFYAGAQRLLVFQQNGRGESKNRGIQAYGEGLFGLEVMSFDCPLPAIVDDSREYLPSDFQADLVLDYLKHPDLSQDLAVMCKDRGIPLIASGKKDRVEGAFTPMICCALSRHPRLGQYGDRFGAPEFAVEMEGERIRDAPFRAEPRAGLAGGRCPHDRGVHRRCCRPFGFGSPVLCTADPSGRAPMYGKSPVHLAAEIHRAALCRAMESWNSSLGRDFADDFD